MPQLATCGSARSYALAHLYNDESMTFNDYKEKSVLTPKSWFDASGISKKIHEVKDIEKYIITFPYMKELIEKTKAFNSKIIEWYPNFFVFEFEGEIIGLVASPVGAPMTAGLIEELIHMGGIYFVLAGGVGVLFKQIKRGNIIIPDGAFRDEGTSNLYLPPGREVKPSQFLSKRLKETCKNLGVEPHVGKAWTIDAPYRETPTRIKTFRNQGAICVDMEASACFAVAQCRKVELAAIFYGGDYVNETGWDFRKKEKNKSEERSKEKMYEVIYKTLKDIKRKA